ncbi:vitamin K epoxide reductase family protein [Tomitella biformata]|uniref:vitamin K epoxide reductase family protein n=1 Tax=Tomitella biformata TaxID=630403 RepID=UPI00046423EF|nr:vitamin K epoxide reductase family protein [Tomitella biformata]
MLPWLLLIAGLLGGLASFILTWEKVELLIDPNYVPSCSFNPVLSCGSVMDTPQASLFGFPNSLLGILGFAMVVATGAAMLAGARMAAWYWMTLWVGLTAAVVMVHWLIYQSLYTIGALCPYCMVVWVTTIPLWWWVTLRNVNYLAKSPRAQGVARFLRKTSLVPPIVWAMIIVTMIADRFWYYWETLL